MKIDKQYLDGVRMIGDTSADELIEFVFRRNMLADLYRCLKLSEDEVHLQNGPSAITQFFLERRALPNWYNTERIKKGQAFFRKYATEVMTLLGALSLPYCYAATPGNKAIYLTEKMHSYTGMRLLETAQFIISVMKDGSFDGIGEGYIQINKTRLIHAMVRYMLQSKNLWNNDWGVPVNQEDMAGTNLAFSYIILRGLENTKFPLTAQEKEDFIYIWRFIGYQLHIEEELLPANYGEADQLETVIKARHFRQSPEGENLIKDLVIHYKQSFPSIPAYFIDGQIRYLLGEEVSNILGLKSQRFKDGIVWILNRLKEQFNKKYNDSASYTKMLKNHEMLRKKYNVAGHK